MKLSILLPVFNESASLETMLKNLMPLSIDKEIIAVDDCSSDNSAAILQKYANEDFRVVRHETNRGKGAAVRTALAHARGDYIIIQDADNELDPNDIPRLLEPIQRAKAQVVYGARNLGMQSLGNRLGNRLLTLATNLLFGIWITDMETCYKVIPTGVMRTMNLQANSFDIEAEITAKLVRAGHKILEVPISYRPRTQDKKMRPIREGFRAIGALVRYRFQKRL